MLKLKLSKFSKLISFNKYNKNIIHFSNLNYNSLNFTNRFSYKRFCEKNLVIKDYQVNKFQ